MAGDKFKMTKFTELVGGTSTENKDGVREILISDLKEFHDHPFKVVEDDALQELAESIRNQGVLVPAIARPCVSGGYELISGHRRKAASILAGKRTMPVFVREYGDDDAVVAMVDSNLQREQLLPSEKAKAYSMKYEAMRHQGVKGEKQSLEQMGEAAGESAKTVQRYICLARLSDDLLNRIDSKQIGILQGVDLSFLNAEQQNWVENYLASNKGQINTVKSEKLKEYGMNGTLTEAMVASIISERRSKKRKVVLKSEWLQQYFPEEMTEPEIKELMIMLLQEWKAQNG